MSDHAKGPNATKADKNPKGGLSAKGRAKFGVQKGVTNYSSASRKDKGRWVSWAMRFTGSPKPVKDDKGQPTRYALMFRAWGEAVPASREAVQAVHAKAVKRSKELKNSDSASLDTELVECFDCSHDMGFERAFIDFASLWTHVETVHLDPTTTEKETEMAAGDKKIKKVGEQFCLFGADGKQGACYPDKPAAVKALAGAAKSGGGSKMPAFLKGGDKAHAEGTPGITCYDPDCDRSFLEVDRMLDHAEAVHTFSDIEELVRDAVRDKYNREGNYRVDPVIPSIYAWCRDFSTDWVVFEMNRSDKGTLYKSSYTITDGVVSLGAPVEVVRKTVYEPVTDSTKVPATATTTGA